MLTFNQQQLCYIHSSIKFSHEVKNSWQISFPSFKITITHLMSGHIRTLCPIKNNTYSIKINSLTENRYRKHHSNSCFLFKSFAKSIRISKLQFNSLVEPLIRLSGSIHSPTEFQRESRSTSTPGHIIMLHFMIDEHGKFMQHSLTRSKCMLCYMDIEF